MISESFRENPNINHKNDRKNRGVKDGYPLFGSLALRGARVPEGSSLKSQGTGAAFFWRTRLLRA